MDTAKLLSSVPTGLWIGGEERRGKSTVNVLDPSDDQVLIAVADATPEDAIAAPDAACAVQAEWAATAPRERGEILRAVFEKITERAEDIAATPSCPPRLSAVPAVSRCHRASWRCSRRCARRTCASAWRWADHSPTPTYCCHASMERGYPCANTRASLQPNAPPPGSSRSRSASCGTATSHGCARQASPPMWLPPGTAIPSA